MSYAELPTEIQIPIIQNLMFSKNCKRYLQNVLLFRQIDKKSNDQVKFLILDIIQKKIRDCQELSLSSRLDITRTSTKEARQLMAEITSCYNVYDSKLIFFFRTMERFHEECTNTTFFVDSAEFKKWFVDFISRPNIIFLYYNRPSLFTVCFNLRLELIYCKEQYERKHMTVPYIISQTVTKFDDTIKYLTEKRIQKKIDMLRFMSFNH